MNKVSLSLQLIRFVCLKSSMFCKRKVMNSHATQKRSCLILWICISTSSEHQRHQCDLYRLGLQRYNILHFCWCYSSVDFELLSVFFWVLSYIYLFTSRLSLIGFCPVIKSLIVWSGDLWSCVIIFPNYIFLNWNVLI